MTRRMFYIALGATVGVLVVRRATSAAKRFSPAGVSSSVTGALGGFGAALSDFGASIRAGMAEREEQLRTELGLDGSHDVVDS